MSTDVEVLAQRIRDTLNEHHIGEVTDEGVRAYLQAKIDALQAETPETARTRVLSARRLQGDEYEVELQLQPISMLRLDVRLCAHEEIEFSGSVEFESGALVFHVNCRACGRSGSVTVTNKDVLW